MTGTRWLGLLLVLGAFLVLFAENIAHSIRRIGRFQESRSRFSWSDLPIVGQLIERRRFHAELTDIRDFIVSLQLAASLGETLSGGLVRAAEQFADRGVFGERLQRQVESRLAIAPEEVIRGLANDFDSEPLRDVLRRLEMVREAGGSTARALRVSAEEVGGRIEDEIKRDIQRSPVRLTIPMAVGVFLPAIALSMYPLVVRLIQNLATY